MSLRDLRQLHLLKPESEWTDAVPRSKRNAWGSTVWGLCAIGGCVLMACGDGGASTWWGLAIFGVSLAAFVHANIKTIESSGHD